MKRCWMRTMAILMAGTMIMSGCSGDTEGSAGSNGKEKTGEASTREEPVEITVMAWDRGDTAPNTTPDNNTLTKLIQDKVLEACNVKVNYLTVPRSGSDDKINVMMAGGTAPDLVFTYNRSLFLDYASKGGLADLSSSIENYGNNIKKYVGVEMLDLCNIDGKQFGISATLDGFDRNKHTVFMRKDWLDTLGSKVPKTKQEFIDTLYEFKEKDPGNVGDKIVPWAVSGKADTEKHFTNFVLSYADSDQWDEKSMTVYEGYIKGIKPGTKEGFRVLNQLYNDGLISPDFAVDTSEDKYKQDVLNGYAGVCIEDGDKPINQEWYDTIKSNVPEAEWIAISCFENYEGKCLRPGNQRLQKMMIVPKTSQEKADAVVKFLDWIVQPEIAKMISFTPEAKLDENGRHIPLTKEEKYALGYPNTMGDYNLLNRNYYELKTKEDVVASRCLTLPYMTQEYLSADYDVNTTDLYFEPVLKKPLESVVKYGTNLDKMVVEMEYKVVSTTQDRFDQVYDEEYQKLVEAGLDKMLREREEYFNTTMTE